MHAGMPKLGTLMLGFMKMGTTEQMLKITVGSLLITKLGVMLISQPMNTDFVMFPITVEVCMNGRC